MTIWVQRHRQVLRLLGLALLAAGLAVTLTFDALLGLALVALSALPLALVQPLILARARSRSVSKVASGNGHTAGIGSEDLDVGDQH